MTTKTTFHLSLTTRDRLRTWLMTHDPIVLLAIPLLLLIVAGLAAHPAPAAPTAPQPIIMIATALATAPPPAATAATKASASTLARAVVAYDSPNGRVIGAIDSGHRYQVVARFGADWLQADVAGSGVVWLLSAEVFDLPSGLADLQPTVAPQVVIVAPAAAPTYQTDSAPAAQPWTAEQDQAYRAQLGLSDADVAQALDDHNARQLTWCANQTTPYCDMVRSAVAK